MQIRFSYHNLDKDKCSPNLEEYANEKKLKSLTRLLSKSDLALADLAIRVEYLTHHNAFSVKLNLKIAKHLLLSQEVKHNLTQAFDLALEKLLSQLRKLENKRQIKLLREKAKIKEAKK